MGNGVTQGAVTVNGNADTTTVTVKQDATVAAVNATFKTGGANETASVKFTAMTAGQTVILGGLTFTATTALTKEQAATAFANLAAGIVPGAAPTFAPLTAGDTQGSGVVANGVYTGALTGWTSGAATGDTVVFTSTATTPANVGDLANTGTATVTVTTTDGKAHDAGATGGVMGVTAGAVSVVDNNATIKTITVDGVGTGSTTTTTSVLETLNVSNQAAAATFVVADSAATLALNLEKVGTAAGDAVLTITSAPATLNVKSTGNNYVNLTAALTETLNVSGTGTLKASATDLAALKTVKVTESAGLSLNAGVADTVTSVDTTGTTGAVTVSIDGTKATYTGGAGKDTVTLTTVAPTKAISLGAGDDKVTLAAGTTAMGANGTIAGGDGTDTLVMVAADAVTASGGAAFASKVTGFERLEVTGATGAQAIDTAALGNYNDVTVATAAASTGLTLNNLTSGATIRLNDGTNVLTTAAIKDADTNTADVLNIVVTDGTRTVATDNNGTIVAAEVETINITTVDGTIETPTNLAADPQNLTVTATKATTINVTGDAALNLSTSNNQKVTLIDGSTMTAALTVQAAGGVASTIKGGSGNDVLAASASPAVVGSTNATGVAATLTNDAVVGVTPVTAVKEVFTATFAGDEAGNDTTIAFDGVTVTLDATAAGVTVANLDTPANIATEFVRQYNANAAATWVAVDNTDGTVTFTAKTAEARVNILSAGFVVTPTTADDTVVAVTAAAPTTDGVDGVTGVKENATLNVAAEFAAVGGVLTDLDLGDSISLTVAGSKYTYTVTTPTMTVDAANAELLTLIKANAAIDATSSYNAGTDTFTFVAATPTATDLAIGTDFTVTDAKSGAVAADKLIGGAGNDILIGNAGLSELTGGEGNDLFVIGTAASNVNSYNTVTDFAAGDLLKLVGATGFNSAKIELGDTAVFQDLANKAIRDIGAGEAAWFQVGGNTYVVMDAGADSTTDFVNDQDFVVKLTGLVDLSNASFNNDYDTIALV